MGQIDQIWWRMRVNLHLEGWKLQIYPNDTICVSLSRLYLKIFIWIFCNFSCLFPNTLFHNMLWLCAFRLRYNSEKLGSAQILLRKWAKNCSLRPLPNSRYSLRVMIRPSHPALAHQSSHSPSYATFWSALTILVIMVKPYSNSYGGTVFV